MDDVQQWCHRHGHEHGQQPVMAVVWFHTDEDALDYVRIKANIAKKVY